METRTYVLLLAAMFFATTLVLPSASFAQQPPSKVDIKIEPIWSDGGNVRFKVSFLQPNTSTPQVHIDYNVILTKKDGQSVFDAAKKSGQNVLHTAEGVVTIPQEPDPPLKLDNGDYQLNATVYGIVFTPVTPISSTMSTTVTPEFSSQIMVATAGSIGAAIVVAKLLKFKRDED